MQRYLEMSEGEATLIYAVPLPIEGTDVTEC